MTLYQVCGALLKEMEALIAVLDERSADFDGVVKMGRTQLQDAVPIRLGQEFAAYASVMRREKDRLERGQKEMLQLNLGGTAVGTGINATLAYVGQVVPLLSEMTGIPFTQSRDLIDTTQNTDCYLALSSALKGCAASLSKICNDLRLMSSGPRDGRDRPSCPAERLLHHARQGQPGDPRGGQPDRLPHHRLRYHGHAGGGGRSVGAERL